MLQPESSDVKHVRQRNRHACLRQRRRLQQWALRVRRHRRIQRRKVKTKWTGGRTRSGASTQKFKRMVLMMREQRRQAREAAKQLQASGSASTHATAGSSSPTSSQDSAGAARVKTVEHDIEHHTTTTRNHKDGVGAPVHPRELRRRAREAAGFTISSAVMQRD